MHVLISTAILSIVTSSIMGCQSGESDLKKQVELQYDHVANIQSTIRFQTAIPLSPPLTPTNQVITRWLGSFWAVFVLCNLDVQGTDRESFTYDRSKFSVQYGGKTYGALQPYSVITVMEDDIGPQDTSVIESAILNTIGLGPSMQGFGPGLHQSLNYRIAIFISDSIAVDKVLTLHYSGQPLMLRGRGHRPATLPGYLPDSPPLPGSCRSS